MLPRDKISARFAPLNNFIASRTTPPPQSAKKMENVFIVSENQPCADNPTMFQAFEWYCPADHKHWQRLARAIPSLAALGITSMWIPPACKASWHNTNGYDIYDLYDLGEFEQKGARHTKWGTKEELVDMVNTANSHKVNVLFDAVLNHKAAADYAEPVIATRVDPRDRMKDIGGPEKIEVWTRYDFKGRGNTYSSLKWNKDHFTGIDYDQTTKSNVLWKFQGKNWAHDVDEELGNYDYLMFADVDHNHPEVRQDLFNWVEWLGSQLQLGGLRIDAVKHYSAGFLRDLVQHIDKTVKKDWFIVGEYWRSDSAVLAQYIEYMNHRISLFDVELCSNFSKISLGQRPDMRTVFDATLAVLKPANTVTFVTNHDTQEDQSLATPIAPYFIPIAYAIILLRTNAGIPCVFWCDLYGSFGPNPKPDRSNFAPPASGGVIIPKLLLARQLYAYGTQVDYFDEPHSAGFTRFGHPSRSGGAGLAVVMNISWRYATKRMCVGRRHAGGRWTDLLQGAWGEVIIDHQGYGTFPVGPRGVSVWTNKSAQGRDFVDRFIFDHDIYRFAEEDRRLLEARIEANNAGKLQTSPSWLQSTSSTPNEPEREGYI